MTMGFRTAKQAVVDLLSAAEAGRYRTIGHQKQARSTDEVRDSDRSVQVYYDSGEFPQSGGSMDGPTLHDIIIRIVLMASSAVEVDLSVLNNPSSTPGQLTSALAGAQLATARADESLDELWDIVYQVIMDTRNDNLGLDEDLYTVENRWVSDFKKNPPIEYSSLVTLSGTASLTLRMDELLEGDTVTAGQDIDVVIDIKDDDHERTGANVEV